jgi:hypothetical protein
MQQAGDRLLRQVTDGRVLKGARAGKEIEVGRQSLQPAAVDVRAIGFPRCLPGALVLGTGQQPEEGGEDFNQHLVEQRIGQGGYGRRLLLQEAR